MKKNFKCKFNTPDDVVKALANANCCREVIPEYSVDYWLDQYIWRVGVDDEMADEAKEGIVYVLLFILNELNSMTKESMGNYILEPEKMLEDVISLGKNRGWILDKHLAVGLCAYIAEDYIFDTGNLQCDAASDRSALEQIIANYPDDVIEKICDPAWEVYFNNLIYEHLEDEDAVYQCHDVDALEKAVRVRECMPSELMRV